MYEDLKLAVGNSGNGGNSLGFEYRCTIPTIARKEYHVRVHSKSFFIHQVCVTQVGDEPLCRIHVIIGIVSGSLCFTHFLKLDLETVMIPRQPTTLPLQLTAAGTVTPHQRYPRKA